MGAALEGKRARRDGRYDHGEGEGPTAATLEGERHIYLIVVGRYHTLTVASGPFRGTGALAQARLPRRGGRAVGGLQHVSEDQVVSEMCFIRAAELELELSMRCRQYEFTAGEKPSTGEEA